MPQSESFCPYKELQPYTEEDRAYFFGREEEKVTIGANAATASLTILYGASGVGKTSVLLAGVIPYLRELGNVTVIVFRTWQERTFLSLLRSEIAKTAEQFGHSFNIENISLDDLLAQTSQITHGKVILVFDQFEEYFVYHSGTEISRLFEVQFAQAVNRDDIEANFLISIREDSLSRLDRFQGRIPNLFSNYLRLEHLSFAAANDAIVKPIDYYNRLYADPGRPIEIDKVVVDEVINQVKAGHVVIGEAGRGQITGTSSTDMEVETPYLQLVMSRLWRAEQEAESRIIRLKTLNDLGGVEEIVRTHLDEAMNALAPSEQDDAAHIFHYLVTPSGSKIALSVPDLNEFTAIPQPRLSKLLDKLSKSATRILRAVAPPHWIQAQYDAIKEALSKLPTVAPTISQTAITRFEIFHDVLAPAILDWRRRYLQSQERIQKEEELARQRRLTEEELARQRHSARRMIVFAAMIFFAVGIVMGFLSYRLNWWGVRSKYLAGSAANSIDVVSWLAEEKFGENIVWDDISSPGTMKALIALRFAYDLDPDSRQIKRHLENYLTQSRALTRPQTAPLELLQNNILILKSIHDVVPYPPLLSEFSALNTRVTRIVDSTDCIKVRMSLDKQFGEATVADEELLNGYRELLDSCSTFVNVDSVKDVVSKLREWADKYEKSMQSQASGTVTIIESLRSWITFRNLHKRDSPEKARADKEIQQIQELKASCAYIDTVEQNKMENFLTCSQVDSLVPRGISDTFSPGTVYVWARVKSSKRDNLTLRWYVGSSLYATRLLKVEASSGYRIYNPKSYGPETRGTNEVRLYNSQNILIGRKVFTIR